jgi:hypothetical protein
MRIVRIRSAIGRGDLSWDKRGSPSPLRCNIERVEAAQIKEKFGTLRIYLRTGGNDFMTEPFSLPS